MSSEKRQSRQIGLIYLKVEALSGCGSTTEPLTEPPKPPTTFDFTFIFGFRKSPPRSITYCVTFHFDADVCDVCRCFLRFLALFFSISLSPFRFFASLTCRAASSFLFFNGTRILILLFIGCSHEVARTKGLGSPDNGRGIGSDLMKMISVDGAGG